METRRVISVIFLYLNIVEAQKYIVCAEKKHIDDCNQLERDNNIKCNMIDNEASCMTKIESGEIDFGAVDAETAFLASKLTSKIIAFASTIPEVEIEQFKYETVIVSREAITNFYDLKGRSYCHPGFDKTDIPGLVLKEFEIKIARDILCNKNFETISEMYLYALNDFFGPSCRPGQWVADKELDKELKRKYPKLTQLCPRFEGMGDTDLERSLNCMLHTPAAISLTTLTTVNERQDKNDTMHYLCKNGTTSTATCVWSKQPHRFLVMNNNEKNKNLPEEIKEWFSPSVDLTIESHNQNRIQLFDREVKYIKQILGLTGDVEMKLSAVNDKREILENFLKPFRNAPTQEDWLLCERSMKWCTISEAEQEKCKWLAQASLNYGIQPVVKCVQKTNELECIRAINKNSKKADLIAISADYGYSAKRNNLSAIAFPETSGNQEINTLLLVKGENITSLDSLQYRKGCFPLYGGIAWLSFVNTIGLLSNDSSCHLGKSLSEWLGESCMPGAMEAIGHDKVDAAKMCELCIESKICDATEPSNTSGVLKCLDERGDFAVIVKDKFVSLPNNVRIMCRNGTLSTIDGIEVDEGCYLSTLTTSEVVTRRNDSNNKDIQLALIEYDRWFASTTHAPFKLFDSFNGSIDLLYKDSTSGFDLPSSEKKAIKNYVDILENVGVYSDGT